MKPPDDRTRANLDVALEEVCRVMPHGGNHAVRKKIAAKLLKSARQGNTTLGGLSEVARKALEDVVVRKPASPGARKSRA
jgi:hypothetical protein